MFQLIKADLYRVSRTKGIYITISLFIVALLLEVIGITGNFGVTIGDINSYNNLNALNSNYIIVGKQMPFIIMSHLDNYLYILLAFIIMFSAIDFSSNCVKNTLSSGITRKKYFLSKYLISIIIATCILLISIFLPTVIISIIYGFGGDITKSYILQIICAFLLELLLYIGVLSFIQLLVFVTKKISYVNTFFFIFMLLPMLVITFITFIYPKLTFLYNFEIVTLIRKVSSINAFTSDDFIRSILVPSILIILCLTITLKSFKDCDVK